MSRSGAKTNHTEGQWLGGVCGYCGAKVGQYLNHYDILQCRCGKYLWALRPKKNGPLLLSKHPELNAGATRNATWLNDEAWLREKIKTSIESIWLLEQMRSPERSPAVRELARRRLKELQSRRPKL